MVEFHFEDVEILDLDPEFFVSWLGDVCIKENGELGDLNIILCSDAYLLDMNREYLDHDYYTDIITFDYVDGSLINGDLFVSIERVVENAEANKVDFQDELKRVIVHGVLHLLGYKDKSDVDEKLMREKEDFYLGFT